MTETPVPLSLKITPQEARERIRTAVQLLVSIVGTKRIAYRCNVNRGSVNKWAAGLHEPRYSVGIYLIAWSDLEKSINIDAKSEHLGQAESLEVIQTISP